MSGKYAARTDVPVQRSAAEIENTLRRYGADQFVYGRDVEQSMVGFRLNGRMVRLNLPMPRQQDYSTVTKYEQAERQRWRALVLVIKAKLEAVDVGISTLEEEFLAGVLLPNGSTVGQWMRPQIEAAYTDGQMPALLPALGAGVA
jgi:hypothetical protein